MDPNDPKSIKRAKRDDQSRSAERAVVWTQLLSSKAGRAFVYDWMQRCHVFSNSFAGDPYRTAFACGEHNIGLQLIAEVMHWCPDQYIQMMREANVKDEANGRPSTNPVERHDAEPPIESVIDYDDSRGEFALLSSRGNGVE